MTFFEWALLAVLVLLAVTVRAAASSVLVGLEAVTARLPVRPNSVRTDDPVSEDALVEEVRRAQEELEGIKAAVSGINYPEAGERILLRRELEEIKVAVSGIDSTLTKISDTLESMDSTLGHIETILHGMVPRPAEDTDL